MLFFLTKRGFKPITTQEKQLYSQLKEFIPRGRKQTKYIAKNTRANKKALFQLGTQVKAEAIYADSEAFYQSVLCGRAKGAN